MSDILFVGGPWHGRVVDVRDDVDVLEVPIPAGQRSQLDPSGVPILTSFDRLPYARRRLTSPSGRTREMFAATNLPPDQAMAALGDVLIALWVESGPDLSERDTEVAEELRDLLEEANARKTEALAETDRAGGPAATLAGDQ